MKNILFISLLIFVFKISCAQENINLVPNYSFENGKINTYTGEPYEPQCNYTNCWNPANTSTLPITQQIKYWSIACKTISLYNTCKDLLNTPDWFYTGCDDYSYNYFLSDEFNESTCNVNLDNTAPTERFIFLYAGYNKIKNCKGKEKYNEGVRVALKNKLTENKTYILKMKIKPIQKKYYCDNIIDNERLIYTGINNLKVHFTEWGLHWNSNSSNNQKWADAAIVWKDFNNDNTQCIWEQVYYEITVPSGKTELKNIVLECKEGGFFIDDVELYEKCPITIYFQNREFNIPNHPYAYFADDKIVAGKNVTTATENGDVVVNQNGKVNFIAGNEVRLKHGFRTNGGEFHAFNQNCNSSKSTMSGKNELIENTSDVLVQNDISIFPNPAQNFVIIDNAKGYTYRLFNSIGKELVSGKITNNKFVVETIEFCTGVYIMHLFKTSESGVNKVTKKIIIYE